jgi:hypothetical protein
MFFFTSLSNFQINGGAVFRGPHGTPIDEKRVQQSKDVSDGRGRLRHNLSATCARSLSYTQTLNKQLGRIDCDD